VTVNAAIELSCGCVRSPRSIPAAEIPDLGTDAECVVHGWVTVIHTTWVST